MTSSSASRALAISAASGPTIGSTLSASTSASSCWYGLSMSITTRAPLIDPPSTGGANRSRCLPVSPFCELLDGLRAERRQVVRPTARDEPVVDVHLLVDPGAAGVADVGP